MTQSKPSALLKSTLKTTLKSTLKAPLKIPTQAFEAHLYDCDGTLADTMTPHIEAWIEELKHHGVDLKDGAIIHELAGVPATQTIAVINERWGSSLDPERVAQLKEDRFYQHFMHRVQPIPEVVALLEESFAKGIKIAVVSGGRKKIVEETLRILYDPTLICKEYL